MAKPPPYSKDDSKHSTKTDAPKASMALLSVVIPVYNASAHLENLLSGIKRALSGTAYELILVDDASEDSSWKVLVSAFWQDPLHLRVFRLRKQSGQHTATLFGLCKAKGAYIATLDDDLQYPPEALHALLEELKQKNVALVYGISTRAHSAWICAGSAFARYLFRWTTPIKQKGSSCRMMTRTLTQSICSSNASYVFIEGLLAQCGAQAAYVRVRHAPQRQSRYSVRRRIALAIQVLFHYSYTSFKLIILLFLSLGCGWQFGTQTALLTAIGWVIIYTLMHTYAYPHHQLNQWLHNQAHEQLP